MKSMLNFIKGVGLFDIVPTVEIPSIRYRHSSFFDDYNKLAGDWRNVGNNIRQAMT